MTVWLTDYDKIAKVTSSTLIPCMGGMYHVINPVLSELAAAKPVVLFDKPVCVYFSQHNRCARRGCQKTHRSEKQIQTLIAARHVQLKEMSSEEREALSKELVEKEQDGVELYHMAASRNARTTMGTAAKELIEGRKPAGEVKTKRPRATSLSMSDGSEEDDAEAARKKEKREKKEKRKEKKEKKEKKSKKEMSEASGDDEQEAINDSDDAAE